jgi:putative methyltransferase (TIGR04325 family)
MNVRQTLKHWMPSFILESPLVSALRHKPSPFGHFGNFASYEDACVPCGNGYADEEVVRVLLDRAFRETRRLQESPQVLDDRTARLGFAMLHARLACGNAVAFHVLDFGGALGDHYWRLRPWLVDPLRWTVVETKPMVRAGGEHFANEELRFSADLGHVKSEPYFVVLACGVLQCMPDPYRTFDELSALGSTYLIVDRLPILPSSQDRLTVNHVDPRLLDVSFPAWFFSESKWLRRVADGWQTVLTWDVPEDALLLDGQNVAYKGFLLRRLGNETLSHSEHCEAPTE